MIICFGSLFRSKTFGLPAPPHPVILYNCVYGFMQVLMEKVSLGVLYISSEIEISEETGIVAV